MNEQCKKCKSPRILHFNALCNDRCVVSFMDQQHGPDYIPNDILIGGSSDEITMSICLECGQVQDEFPQPNPNFYCEEHEFVSVENEVITNGYACVHCGALRDTLENE